MPSYMYPAAACLIGYSRSISCYLLTFQSTVYAHVNTCTLVLASFSYLSIPLIVIESILPTFRVRNGCLHTFGLVSQRTQASGLLMLTDGCCFIPMERTRMTATPVESTARRIFQ